MPDFRYSFNRNHEMIVIERLDGTRVWLSEFVFRDGESEIGIAFNTDGHRVYSLSECVRHGGRLVSFALGTCEGFGPEPERVHRYEREKYAYAQAGLSNAICDRFSMGADINRRMQIPPMFGRSKYDFLHDDEGYLSHFKYSDVIVDRDTGEMIMRERRGESEYAPIGRKRKV